jgi:hypothetical protein
MNFYGDLVQFYGSNPSGHPLTVIVNSLANSLYMRYVYCLLNPEGQNCDNFKKDVALMTYGDDNIMGVKQGCDWFNHTRIQYALSTIGIKYTMADKEAESVPYISITQASFLKREWRFDNDIGYHMCPLEHDSIVKMLTRVVASSIPLEEQTMEVVASAVREYFHYGKDVFELKSEMLQKAVEEAGLLPYVEDHTFPSWLSLKEKFLN